MLPNFFKIITIVLKVVIGLIIAYVLYLIITNNSNSQIGGLFGKIKSGIADVYRMIMSLAKGQVTGLLTP